MDSFTRPNEAAAARFRARGHARSVTAPLRCEPLQPAVRPPPLLFSFLDGVIFHSFSFRRAEFSIKHEVPELIGKSLQRRPRSSGTVCWSRIAASGIRSKLLVKRRHIDRCFGSDVALTGSIAAASRL